MTNITPEVEDIYKRRERRKVAKRLMNGAQRKTTDQYASDGDPLPAKGAHVPRYLLCQINEEGDLYYVFMEQAWEAGIYDISDDSDYYTNWTVDLDTEKHLRIDPARGFYVQEQEGYEFPQPDKGFTRVFFYVDITPADLPALMEGADLTNDALGPMTIGWLAGEQRNNEEDN